MTVFWVYTGYRIKVLLDVLNKHGNKNPIQSAANIIAFYYAIIKIKPENTACNPKSFASDNENQ